MATVTYSFFLAALSDDTSTRLTKRVRDNSAHFCSCETVRKGSIAKETHTLASLPWLKAISIALGHSIKVCLLPSFFFFFVCPSVARSIRLHEEKQLKQNENREKTKDQVAEHHLLRGKSVGISSCYSHSVGGSSARGCSVVGVSVGCRRVGVRRRTVAALVRHRVATDLVVPPRKVASPLPPRGVIINSPCDNQHQREKHATTAAKEEDAAAHREGHAVVMQVHLHVLVLLLRWSWPRWRSVSRRAWVMLLALRLRCRLRGGGGAA